MGFLLRISAFNFYKQNKNLEMACLAKNYNPFVEKESFYSISALVRGIK